MHSLKFDFLTAFFQADLLRSCETGCRLLSIIDAISIGDRTEEGTAASINNCNRSCDASYSDLEVATACKQGCLYQVGMGIVITRLALCPG